IANDDDALGAAVPSPARYALRTSLEQKARRYRQPLGRLEDSEDAAPAATPELQAAVQARRSVIHAQREELLPRPDAGHPPAGSRPLTVVPWPGSELTSSVPPCAASRSAMPCRPEPACGPPDGSPAPSSLTENSRPSPFPASRITARVARACLATFCSASSAQ